MPNLSELRKNSINFTDHYSFVNGGGSTFNSEFMINTGYATPYTYNQNAYTFSKNNFDYSLPRLFKSVSYTVNAFHMNSSEYYSEARRLYAHLNNFIPLETGDIPIDSIVREFIGSGCFNR